MESVFQSNIIPNNPIRVQRIEGDRIIRLPAKSLRKWLKLAKADSTSTPGKLESDLPQYNFQVSAEKVKNIQEGMN